MVEHHESAPYVWDCTNFPFAMIVALVTLLSLLFSRESKRIPWTRESITLLLFVGWMFITTTAAIYSELAWAQFDKVIKIQLMTFVALMVINTPERVKLFVAITALSLGFYGFKGEFTITGVGANRVLEGPPGTSLRGNNEIGWRWQSRFNFYFLARNVSSDGFSQQCTRLRCSLRLPHSTQSRALWWVWRRWE